MLRLFATASVLAFIVSACAPDAPTGDETASASEEALVEAAGTPPEAATEPKDFQLSYKLESDNYTVTSEIDPAILAFEPALAWRFWSEAKTSLSAFGGEADAAKKVADEDAAASGQEPWFYGYSLDYTYTANAVFDDVISIRAGVGSFTGGAHPNYYIGGENYRKGVVAPLALSDVITDEAAFGELVVAALVEEKVERGYEASTRAGIETSLREMLAPSAEVPDLYKGKWVLESSTEVGKVGGISVLFSPYDVGSYAEGAYTATLPAADLAPILTEAWASKFGGLPLVEEEGEAP